eukprot:m51a1_g2903 hypothetical protein (328) ;mRNA; f:477916-479116
MKRSARGTDAPPVEPAAAPKPPKRRAQLPSPPPPFVTCSVISDKGSRAENEDAHFYCEEAPLPFFGVLDGHGYHGREASHQAARTMRSCLRAATSSPATGAEGARAALVEAFGRAHEGILDYARQMPASSRDFGTTAAVAVVTREREVVCAWAGDTRALLLRRDADGGYGVVPLTRDHTLRDPAELARLRSAGGEILDNGKGDIRVRPPRKEFTDKEVSQGRLCVNMSRALGHIVLGSYGVIATPEVSVERAAAGDRLVIASDGLWKSLTSEEAAEVAWAAVSPRAASRNLVDAATRRLRAAGELRDNVTVITAFVAEDPATSSSPV